MRTRKLGELCKAILSGGTPSTKEPSYWNGDIPWITSADIQGDFTAIPRKFVSAIANPNILPANNVLVVTRVGLGKVATSNTPIAFSQDIQGLILKDGIYHRYIVYALSEKVKRFKEISRGATIKGVTRSDLEEIEVPLPSFSQQKEIAHVLSQADKARQKRKVANGLTDQFLQSTFLSLFGDPVRNEKKWPLTSILTSGCKVQIGPFGTQLHAVDYIEGGIPLINPMHIQDLRIKANPAFSIAPEKYAELKNYHLQEGDIIMGRRGEMGRCAVVTIREVGWLCGTGSLIIRPSVQLNSVFLHAVMSNNSMRKVLENNAQGVTMANLNQTIINNLEIPIPPLKRQQLFAAIVAQTETLRQRQRAHAIELEGVFQGLMQRYFD